MENVVSQKRLLEKYIKENKKEAAVKLIFDLIAKHVRANQFAKADELREKLFEVDSMALPEIVKSGEILEATEERPAVLGYRWEPRQAARPRRFKHVGASFL